MASDSGPRVMLADSSVCAKCGGEPKMVALARGHARKQCQTCGSTGPFAPRIQGKQAPFEGQAASAAPSITDAEPRTGGATGQGWLGLAAERNADALAPTFGGSDA